MTIIRFIFAILLILFLIEQVISIKRKYKRRKLYKMAVERSKETGLPLLVIGDPHNGVASIVTGSDYDCGDVCLDLTGCPKCPCKIKGRLEDYLSCPEDKQGRGIDLNQYVVYISCVLEYVDDLDLIASRLRQMDQKNLFIVNVEWYSPVAYLYPYFLTREQPPKWVIYECPPYGNRIEYKRAWK